MPGRSPAGPLIREHRLIERLVAILRDELASLAQAGRADPVLIDRATGSIRAYADRCHHGKEEDILFSRLAAKSLSPRLAAAMQDLIEDHVHGRTLTRKLTEANRRYAAGDGSALGEIEKTMGGSWSCTRCTSRKRTGTSSSRASSTSPKTSAPRC